MKIIQLKAENVKRLTAVDITPEGNLVVVGGRNGQGKTSVLDSIAWAIGGKDLVQSDPVRHGADKATIEVTLDDIVVTRTIKPNGASTLAVRAADGAKYPSPQTMLDKLFGSLSFDPLAFTRMHPKVQLDTLRGLVGLDFTGMDRKRAGLYDERTAINREVKRIEGAIASKPVKPDAPKEPVSVADLSAELERAHEHNRANTEKRNALEEIKIEGELLSKRLKETDEEIRQLEDRLKEMRDFRDQTTADIADKRKKFKAQQAIVNGLVDINLAPIREQIANAESINAAVRQNQERLALVDEKAKTAKKADELTATIEAIDADKAAQLAAAKFPVDGLAFDESGITFNGVPFDQASSAEQLRVSVAMGLALNPDLKVLLIRDGSLLDDESLALIADMAKDADAQLWLERVGEGDEVQVVIEAGRVKDAAAV